MAAAAAVGGNVNGWGFWYVEQNGQLTVLADLRTQYLRDHGGNRQREA